MARIPIYDSGQTEGNNGQAVEHTLEQNSWKTSRPVRLIGGPAGDQRNVSYEFMLQGTNLDAFAFEWYQEFFGDTPYVNIASMRQLPPAMRQDAPLSPYPTERLCPDTLQGFPWAREQIAIAGAIGAIDHYNIVRSMTMQVPSLGSADCRWYPMLVHGYWTRLKIRTTTGTAGVDLPRLRVFAHVGGATDIAEYCERINTVFDWGIPE